MDTSKTEFNSTENTVQFEALFDHATIGIIVTDNRGRIINFNPFAQSQFGYTKAEVTGNSIEMLLPENFRHSHVKMRNHFYEHPSPRRMGEGRDLFAQKKDGTRFPVEISLSFYHSRNEVYVIAFVIDISVRKKSEAIVLNQRDELERITKEISHLNEELEQKVDARTTMLKETLNQLENSREELSRALENEKNLNELKSRFVTTASHEFRTPLSTILSSAFLLEKYNDTNEVEKRKKHLRHIKDAVADMKNILEDFLSLGKLEEGLVSTNRTIIPAADFISDIQNIIEETRPLCKKEQQIALLHTGSFPVNIDRHIFRNILLNLISNAIKFSPESSTIQVECRMEKDQLTVTVKDEGIGISEEDQQHLFKRFFRAKNATNIQGTGLGLHIISKYLELLDGTIQLKSELNHGTTFTIIIPFK